jgi:Tfp pilus assembly protein PilF
MPLKSKPFLTPEAHVEEGNRLFREGSIEGAIASYEAAIEADRGYARAHYNLAVALQQRGQGADAATHYAAAVAAEPRMSQALVNWGNLRKDEGDLDGAASLYRRALAIEPAEALALNNLASIALERGEVAEAKALYSRAAAAPSPAADSAAYNLALIALREGDFAAGWDGYELRLRADPHTLSLAPVDLPRAEARHLVHGLRLAIPREQGLGDQLLFGTLLPELAARGVAAHVEVDPRLVEACRRSVPALRFVIPSEAPAAFAACERQIPLGSLPRLLRRHRADFASQPAALLRPSAARVREMRARVGGPGRIAIAWRSFQGAGRRHVEARKSAPLEAFAAFAGTGARLVDVQYGEVAQERAVFDARHPGLRLHLDGVDLRNDLEGALAAIEACDLVVTTSNATAHLAGALGKRAWLVYLDGNPPFHYWVPTAEGRSLWYPSVEILAERSWSDWADAFGAVAVKWRAENRA